VPVFTALTLLQTFLSPFLIPGRHALRSPTLLQAAARFAAYDGLGHVRVEVQDVHRETAQPNAEAAGIGPTRRVILWDTIFQPRFGEREREAVVAHELGHLARHHALKALGWYALLALPLALAVALATRGRGGMYEPAAVPVAIFVLAVGQFFALPLRAAAQRRYEAEADWIALQTTRDPAAQRHLMADLSLASLTDPAPPWWEHVLLDDHPTIMQRIAMAQAWPGARRAP
jgi:STE24 endopeptidase